MPEKNDVFFVLCQFFVLVKRLKPPFFWDPIGSICSKAHGPQRLCRRRAGDRGGARRRRRFGVVAAAGAASAGGMI